MKFCLYNFLIDEKSFLEDEINLLVVDTFLIFETTLFRNFFFTAD